MEHGKVVYSNQPCATSKPQDAVEPEKTAAEIQAEFDREVADRKEEERLDKIKHEEDERRYAHEREQLLSDQANVPQVRSEVPVSENEQLNDFKTKWALIFVGSMILYFVPTIVANAREHHNSGAITILNLLLGWTLLGWIIALVWAATAVRQKPTSLTEHS